MPVILEQRPSTLAPSLPDTLPQAAKHLCFDIETGNARPEDIEVAQQFVKPCSNTKDPAKQQEQMEKKRKTIAEESALLDAAPIACIAFVTESEKAIFYHLGFPWGKGSKKIPSIKGFDGSLLAHKDERDMLIGLRTWLDRRATPGSIVSGFNIYHFDLPKLRSGYVRNRLTLPMVIQPEARDAGVEVYDVMKRFLRGFTTEKADEYFISLEEVEARLGLPSYKNRVSGAEIPGMVAAGKVREVLTYMFMDALSTYAAFLCLTGQYKDQSDR